MMDVDYGRLVSHPEEVMKEVTAFVGIGFDATCSLVCLDGEAAVLHDVHDIVEDGADDAHRIDAAMAVEILVLGREEGIDHAGRNGGDGNVEAALAREFADEVVNTPSAPIISCGM